MASYDRMSIYSLALCFICFIVRNDAVKITSLDKIYDKGVKAYTKERWSECINQFEDALHLYKLYNSINNNCWFKCKAENIRSQIHDNIEDLKIFESFFNVRDCLIHCQKQGFEEVHMYSNVSETILSHMQQRKPYGYLHMCYFQMNMLPKAASAAYTYLRAHPDNKDMLKNVKYYTEQPEVDINEVTDLEIRDYQLLYKLGLEAYSNKKWGETIANMEEVITNYMTWENTCRAACEKLPEDDCSSEFTISVTNKIASLLTCRQKCQDDLKDLYNSGTEFLGDILNYLQMSYYQFNRLDDAAKCVASYLMLLPDDEDMVANKNIYSSLIDKGKFIERSDIVYYYKRDKNEKKLLDFFHKANSDH